ncbi:unnamed protein product [Mytilus edulis]|uniref:Exonuclease domain-containing protein n=1 Tax=Mytilus edulis TaxID=6550 RepID=A0A8S3PTC7_MYTED|nr:unnamed protein product [Mytilus edulis]
MADSVVCRDKRGRFSKTLQETSEPEVAENIEIDHNYGVGHLCIAGATGCAVCCPGIDKLLGSTKINTSTSWHSGRRLVEWGTLLDHLKFCSRCYNGPLILSHETIKGEMKCGLGGYLYIQCTSCQELNRVPYGSTHKENPSSKGMPSFCVNTKLGAAMIDALGGPQRVNNVLSTLNLPPISHKNLKVMERRAGEMIEGFANLSMDQRCREAFEAEKSNAAEDENGTENMLETNTDSHTDMTDTNTDSHTDMTDTNSNNRNESVPAVNFSGMTVCADHGWQKRGFDSLTGHTFLMSKREYGNKVIKTIVKHRTCGTCKWWKRNRPGRKPRPHRCVWNHRGSARLMESQAGMQAVKELLEQGTPVKTIEGDGDNTLIARLKSELNLTVTKKFDKNHTIKNIVARLYDLQKNNKNLKISSLVIRHLTKSIKYVFAKNQGQPDDMKNNLEALIPHQFGDHSLCQPRFCGYKRKPSVKYLHRSLPYKTPLSDPVLREKLQNLFEPVILKAASYADLGSSQACEHANRAASLRAPKHLHYGESESLDFRVKASAACINEGRNYLSETFKRHGLSPGSFTVPYNSKKDHEREKRQKKSKLPEQKLRRLKLKEERITSKGACEATEGASYESEISFSEQAEDIERIPDAIPKPLFTAVSSLDNPTFVIIDLETTDLIRRNIIPHIVQIAAKEHRTQTSFNRYIPPQLPMSNEAEKVTGIVWDGRKLFYKGVELDFVNIKVAISDFFMWLNQFSNAVLVAHNGKNFDFRVLSTAVYNCNMYDNFTQIVMGFIDSLALFRSNFPKIEKYNQPFLAQHFCKEEYNAHNAVDDVNMLDKILIAANVSKELMLKLCYNSNSHLLQENFIKAKAKNLPSFHPLIASGVMKMTTAENIAGSGLNCAHLKLIYTRKGEDGLIDVLMSKTAFGKPRVSNDKKLMCSVVQKMGNMFSEL